MSFLYLKVSEHVLPQRAHLISWSVLGFSHLTTVTTTVATGIYSAFIAKGYPTKTLEPAHPPEKR